MAASAFISRTRAAVGTPSKASRAVGDARARGMIAPPSRPAPVRLRALAAVVRPHPPRYADQRTTPTLSGPCPRSGGMAAVNFLTCARAAVGTISG